MIVEGPLDFTPLNVFVRLRMLQRTDVTYYLKSEMFNPAGSIKFKPAAHIISRLQAQGRLQRGGGIIETTSGNMGIALSIAARSLGCRFVCVADEKITLHNRALLQVYGTEMVILPGSSLKERYAYIERRVRQTPDLVWTQQFINPENPLAHEATTAAEILQELPGVTHLFVGTGTAGTLSGCAHALGRHGRRIRLIAVDAVGSCHFSQPPACRKRLLPGIGASERSPFLQDTELDDVVVVPEDEAIAACRSLVQGSGWLFGASSGSVLAAMMRLEQRFEPGDVVVGIAADSGERYLDCVYNDNWVEQHYPGCSHGIEKRTAWKQIEITGGKRWRDSMNDPSQCGFHVVTASTTAQILERDHVLIGDIVRWAYEMFGRKQGANPHSSFLRFSDQGEASRNRIIALPAFLGGDVGVAGIKWVASFPRNLELGLPRASAAVILNSAVTGRPFACIEGSLISAARTAASAVLGADLICTGMRERLSVGFVGAGVIARAIMKSFVAKGWQFERVCVFDTIEQRAAQFADSARELFDASICVAGNLDELLQSTDLIVFATTAPHPYVMELERLPRAARILNISLRDLGPEVILGAENVVDDVDHCLREQTSPHLAQLRLGSRNFDLHNIYDCLGPVGSFSWQPSGKKPVVFSPFGLGVLDVAVAEHVFRQAVKANRAIRIDGFLPDDGWDSGRSDAPADGGGNSRSEGI